MTDIESTLRGFPFPNKSSKQWQRNNNQTKYIGYSLYFFILEIQNEKIFNIHNLLLCHASI